jgi:hypothetical protein
MKRNFQIGTDWCDHCFPRLRLAGCGQQLVDYLSKSHPDTSQISDPQTALSCSRPYVSRSLAGDDAAAATGAEASGRCAAPLHRPLPPDSLPRLPFPSPRAPRRQSPPPPPQAPPEDLQILLLGRRSRGGRGTAAATPPPPHLRPGHRRGGAPARGQGMGALPPPPRQRRRRRAG